MSEFRLYTPEGASMDLNVLIQTCERRAKKAEDEQQAQRRVLQGAHFRDTDSMQKAVAEVSIQIGAQIAWTNAADLLKAVRKELVAKSAA